MDLQFFDVGTLAQNGRFEVLTTLHLGERLKDTLVGLMSTQLQEIVYSCSF